MAGDFIYHGVSKTLERGWPFPIQGANNTPQKELPLPRYQRHLHQQTSLGVPPTIPDQQRQFALSFFS